MQKIKKFLFFCLSAVYLIFTVSIAKSEVLEVSDVMLDIQILNGESVTVKGYFLNAGTMAFLYEKLGSMSFIQIDSQGADRDTRKYLLKECSTGCNNIKLKGTVFEEYGMIKMNLESLVE